MSSLILKAFIDSNISKKIYEVNVNLCAKFAFTYATRHSLTYHFAFLLPLTTFPSPYPVNSVNPVQSKKPPVTRYSQLFHHFDINDCPTLATRHQPLATSSRLRRSSFSLNVNN
jgi:hypothetical protein